MSDPLVVVNEHPVRLDGFLDGGSALQIRHQTGDLDDHSQCLHAKHDDLENPNGRIRIRIFDFASGGDDWTITVSHLNGTVTVNWPRSTDHAYYDFGPMTDALEVDVVGTSDASPPQTKTRTIWIKAGPVSGQPDQ